MSNTENLFSRLGGEVKVANTSVTRNAQDEFRPTPETETEKLVISAAMFDSIVTYFQKKGVSESLARTYGVALFEISQETGKPIEDLIDINDFSTTVLSDDTIDKINELRSKTSQIGKNIIRGNQSQIKRTINA